MPAHIADSPGWREEATLLKPGIVRAPVQGFDLVRNEFGGWRVLEDNVRAPSGAAYSMAARRLMDATVPDLPRPSGLLDPHTALPLLRETLLAGAASTAHQPGADATAAVFTSGPNSAAWFEHSALAEGAQLMLVTADDLDVVWSEGEAPKVIEKATATVIHVALSAARPRARRPRRQQRSADRRAGHARRRGRRRVPGQRSRQRHRRRQGDVLQHSRPDRVLPRRTPPARIGADVPHQRPVRTTHRARARGRARDQTRRRRGRPRGADRPVGSRLVGGRTPQRDRRQPRGLGRARTRSAVVAADVRSHARSSLGTSTCAPSSTCAEQSRATRSPPTSRSPVWRRRAAWW